MILKAKQFDLCEANLHFVIIMGTMYNTLKIIRFGTVLVFFIWSAGITTVLIPGTNC